ncbi:hypothetical protein J5N97_030079 [Dioscorea zingiberensis]|uniref:Uncharacterized protein n=1 Tax=Dioscorea zingiberensis TaxID=325984 RepID=A0A9D5H3X7_9LILI|nr:hypothetical protein J5N97_030079 [Dioscorea zingiberensis]
MRGMKMRRMKACAVEDDDGEDEDGDGDEKDEDGDGGEGGDDDDDDDEDEEDDDEHEVLGGDNIPLEDDIRKEIKVHNIEFSDISHKSIENYLCSYCWTSSTCTT